MSCKEFDARKGVTPDPEQCIVIMFDGDWEDNDVYALVFANSTYDPETSILSIHTISDFISPSEKLRTTRLEGTIHYQLSALLSFTAQLKCENGIRLTLVMAEESVADVRGPKVKSSFIVTVLSMCQLFAVLIFSKECADSERIAKSVSVT